ncbi:MAG: sigma-70 family RNA polymerase sigma factor [Planctomycetes bacterium]|nr:sigma-70 family RNA polymerase sigma factor [Planctomycetota bacterium]
MAGNVDRNAPNELESLVAHAGGLRALAYQLVGDAHAAEDVLQDTFVRVLSKPSAARAPAGAAAWLRTIVRGLALNHRRGAAHRSAREAEHARASRTDERGERVPDAVARGEALERVVAAVLALDEPYKTVVLLRYFEGLSPAEIAARTDAPLATVASRLQRAHQTLRARLEQRRGGLAFALAPLLGKDALRFAPVPGPSAPVAKGVLLMSTKTIVAAGAFVLAVVCWWLFSLREETPLARARGAEAARIEASRPGSVEGAPDVARPAGPERASAAGVASLPDGASVAAAPAPRIDGPGPFEFELEFLVVDAFGFPVQDAEISAAPDGQPLADFGTSAWNGRLKRTWRGFEPVLDLVVRASGDGGHTDLRHVRVAAGVHGRVTLALPVGIDDASAESEELVFETVGGSVSGGTIVFYGTIGGGASEFELDAHGNGVWEDPFLYASDPSVPVLSRLPVLGNFFSHGGELRLEGAGLIVEAIAVHHFEPAAGAEPPKPEAFTLRGVVTTPSGKPAANVPVTLLAQEGMQRRRLETNEAGAFAFDDCRAGPAVVFAGGPGLGFAWQDLALAPAIPALDLALEERSTLFVRLVDETGAPLAGWRVEAWADERGHDFVRSATAGEDGRAVLYGVGAAPLFLDARPVGKDDTLRPAKRVAERVWAQKDELVIAIEGGGRLARVELVLASATGLVAGEGVVRLERADGVAAVPIRARDVGEGDAARRVWSLAGIVPGTYRLVAGAPGEAWTDFGPIEVRAEDALELGERRFAPRARLAVAFDAQPSESAAAGVDARSADAAPRERADARFFVRRQGAVVRSRPFDVDLPDDFGVPTGAFRLEWTRRAAVAPAPGPVTTEGALVEPGAVEEGPSDADPAFEEQGTPESHALEGRAGATTKLPLAPRRP